MKNFVIVFFLVLQVACSMKTYTADVRYESYRMDDKMEATHSLVDSIILPYREAIEKEMNSVVGWAEKDMFKVKPNSPLNNWMADMLLDLANEMSSFEIDFAIQNFGGIRIPQIAAGEVTRGKIFELMPFENKLVILKSSGETVRKLFDRIAQYGGWPLSRGTSFTIIDDQAMEIMVNGKPFDLEKQYTFALPDFIADGGDDCFFLADSERIDLELLIRDGILLWLGEHNGIIPYNDEIRIFTE
ncbi:MAG TPA: 5'-nucleotidase C-terminal domain-containing protein [Saprospiraceae bacterium]|nr:5'-nucleotidase C-terminal domain-containing protein [Saprospiraceae bacterium]